MRADRLLSILMILQSRGTATAGELSAELEVSERTIYRDVIALSAAGVPIYGIPGPQGGYALVESYRTSLTGLTPGEVRALFTISLPAALHELGLSAEFKAAIRKLSAALPDAYRSDEERVRQRILLDSDGWHQGDESVPHLQPLYQAVWQDQQIQLKYRPLGMVDVELVVDPYALVAKAGVWFLISHRNSQIHVHRVAELLDVQLLEDHFTRPAHFDLQAFWSDWCREREKGQIIFNVTVRVSPGFISWLPVFFGNTIRKRIEQALPPDAQGRITLDLSFDTFETARLRLLSCGAGLEVLAPKALRLSIQDYAAQITGLYGSTSG